MPGFDGTGPRGLGPMTGGGEGLCILKLPDRPDGDPAASAGKRREGEHALAHLQWEIQRIEATLGAIRARLEQLEVSSAQTTGVER